jgi:hypothetical protein
MYFLTEPSYTLEPPGQWHYVKKKLEIGEEWKGQEFIVETRTMAKGKNKNGNG